MRYALTALGLIAIALVGTLSGMAFAQEGTTTSESVTTVPATTVPTTTVPTTTVMSFWVFRPRFNDKWATRNRIRVSQCAYPKSRPPARDVAPERRRAVLDYLNHRIKVRRAMDTLCLPLAVRHLAGGPGRWRLPLTYGSWMCIHGYEGAWNDPNAPYYGGLQMDMTFQRQYGSRLLKHKGTANHWDPMEQMWIAEHARTNGGRGWYPWPKTARYCGLI